MAYAPRRNLAALAALVLTLAAPVSQALALEALGPPLPANGEEPDLPRCISGSGRYVQLNRVTIDEPEKNYELHLQAVDDDDEPVGGSVVVVAGLERPPSGLLACDSSRNLTVFWSTADDPCLQSKRFSDDGSLLAGPIDIAGACEEAFAAHIDRRGQSWLVMRRLDSTSGRWDLLVGGFDDSGIPLPGFGSGPLAIGIPSSEPPGRVSLASNSAGETAVGYLAEAEDHGEEVFAEVALFDASGLVSESDGAVFPLFLARSHAEVRLEPGAAPADFELFVFSERWGRWTRTLIARDASLAVGALPSRSVGNSVPRGLTVEPPNFETGVRVAASKKFRAHTIGEISLATAPGGAWTIHNTASIEYTNGNADKVVEAHASTDEGRSFASDFSIGDELPSLASAGGTIIRVTTNQLRRLIISRSVDGGETFTQTEPGARMPPELECEDDVVECSRNQLAVVRGPDGRWLIVWRGDVVEPDGDRPGMVKILRSEDDGATWITAGTVGEFDEALGYWGLAVKFADKNRVMVAWRDPNIHALASFDGGGSWTPMDTVVELESATVQGALGELEVAPLEDGSWILVFDAADYETKSFGTDGDIFAAVSDATVSSWERPVALNDWARSDAAVDVGPTLAFLPQDGDPINSPYGTVVVWTSHQPVLHEEDLDADLYAVHTNDGVLWSAATPVHADAQSDRRWDGPAKLATNEFGSWLLVSRERDLLAANDHLEDFSTYAFYPNCGDGTVEDFEECDDNNVSDGDGCDRNCTETGCGNGIQTGNEPCDDGNDSKRDSCRKCVVAKCGDRVRWPEFEECDDGNAELHDGCDRMCRVEACGNGIIDDPLLEECDDGNLEQGDGCSFCRFEECGNGLVQADEQCDDGNASQNDACLATCELARCGDSFLHVGVEECDDANTSNADACTNSCKDAACGDGFTQEGEACDDGDASNYDECLNDCSLSRCGDGFQNFQSERCDDGNSNDDDTCRNSCELPPACGDANFDGRRTASDALSILRVAVGGTDPCPPQRCDLNSDGRITASDALTTLRSAVDPSLEPVCFPTPAQVSFFLVTPEPLNAVQFAASFDPALGAFAVANEAVECSSALLDASAVGNVASPGIFRGGAITLESLASGAALMTCVFLPVEEGSSPVFTVTIEDASGESGDVPVEAGVEVVAVFTPAP